MKYTTSIITIKTLTLIRPIHIIINCTPIIIRAHIITANITPATASTNILNTESRLLLIISLLLLLLPRLSLLSGTPRASPL